MPLKTKYFFANVKQIEKDSRQLEAIASTSDLDREDEIILPSAFVSTIESFKANPVILATHLHRLATGSSPVIGSAIPESVQITEKDVGFRMRFASTALGEEYWQLYKDGHMKAFSVGFIPMKGNWQDNKGKRVFIHEQIELVEISAVPVPSNRAALVRAKGFDDLDENADNLRIEISNLKSEILNLKSLFESSLEDIKSLLVPGSDEFAESLLSGDDSRQQVPCGEEEKSGLSLSKLKKTFEISGE